MTREDKILLAVTIPLTLIDFAVVGIFLGYHVFGPMMTNARAGCFPWSPKIVPYHAGMMVCPGQSVEFDIPLPTPGWHRTKTQDEKGSGI